MKPTLDPDNRLGYRGDLKAITEHAAAYFGIGQPTGLKHLAEGYEDCNIQIQAQSGTYVIKLFADNQLGDYSKTRRGDDVAQRLVDIINAIRANGANTPELVKGKEYLYHEDGLVAMCYKWLEGASYYDLDRAPSKSELEHIVEQAAKINTTNLRPVYYHDIWAVPHIHALAGKVDPHLSAEDKKLVTKVLARFDALHIDSLPKCLTHGDLTKGNVLLGANGQPYLIDFSVTNWTTRIIEHVLIISNLMYDEKDDRTIQERSDEVVALYQQFNKLTDTEIKVLPDLCLAGSAMEFLGGVWRQKFLNDTAEETAYWLELGRKTLTREL